MTDRKPADRFLGVDRHARDANADRVRLADPEWRCVGCKRTGRSALEPENCPDCGGTAFARVDGA